MSIENATQHQPSPEQKKLQAKGPARPEGADAPEEGQFSNEDFNVIATKHGWTMGTYTNKDGSTGFILTNGQSMFHFDVNGNIVMATGKPGQSGCGGKVVIHAKDHHEKTDTYALHVRGNDDEQTTEEDGSTTKSAPYSIYVEGDVAIESQGGDVGIKGDNITLNAVNNLTLRSGENINIEPAEGQGKVNVTAADINMDSSFTRFTTSGGFYVDGSGEFAINQKDSVGASTSINSIGTVNHVINGDYNVRATGNIQLESDFGHLLMKTTKGGMARVLNGDDSQTVRGLKDLTVLGKSVNLDEPPAAYKMTLGSSMKGSLEIKGASFFNATFVGASIFNSTNVNIVGKTAVTMTGKSIFLN